MSAIQLLRETGKGYISIPKDKMITGWVSSDDYLPVPFDIVRVKTDLNSNFLMGWWTGTKWLGARIKPDSQFKFWKYSKEDL